MLVAKDLPVSGKKDDLIARLLEHEVLHASASAESSKQVHAADEPSSPRAAKRPRLDIDDAVVKEEIISEVSPIPTETPSKATILESESTAEVPDSKPVITSTKPGSVSPTTPALALSPPSASIAPVDAAITTLPDKPLTPSSPKMEEKTIEEPEVKEDSAEDSEEEEEEEVYVPDASEQQARTDLYLDTVSDLSLSPSCLSLLVPAHIPSFCIPVTVG